MALKLPRSPRAAKPASADPAFAMSEMRDLIALALRRAHAVRPLLRETLLPWIHPEGRRVVEGLIASIDRRDILQAGVSDDLHDLLLLLDEEISDMVVETTMWSDHDCDVTGNSWTETYWPPEAQVLAVARAELSLFVNAIGAVLDRRQVDHLLETSRWRSARPRSSLRPSR